MDVEVICPASIFRSLSRVPAKAAERAGYHVTIEQRGGWQVADLWRHGFPLLRRA